jgi:polar amino acid transport system substrate-binding protein
MRTRTIRLFAVVLALALVAGACGKKDKTAAKTPPKTTATTKPASQRTTPLGKMLPKAIRKAKHIKVGSDIAYAPIEFYKAGTQEATGLDVDLCNAMALKFGVFKCDFVETNFDGIIPALNAHRFDIIMSAMSDTKERQGQVDFVDYFNAGTAILVAKGNPKHINSLADLCGKTVGLEKGTTQEQLANQQKTACNGNLNVVTYPKDTDALAALKAGRSDADMNDFPVAAYNAQTSDNGNDFQVVGQQANPGPYGIGTRKASASKDDAGIQSAFQGALKAIIADGTYDTILNKWNVSQGALKTAAINGGS